MTTAEKDALVEEYRTLHGQLRNRKGHMSRTQATAHDRMLAILVELNAAGRTATIRSLLRWGGR